MNDSCADAGSEERNRAGSDAPAWRRVIGIVGGLGPYAHIELERLILHAAAQRLAGRLGRATRDQDYPEWIVASAPATPDRTRAILEGGESPAPQLERSLRRLSDAGADFAVIACVTAHAFFGELRARSPLPLLDVVRETFEEARRRVGDGGRVGILATTGTLRARVFERTAREGERQGAGRVETISLLDLPDGERLQEELTMAPIYGPLRDGARIGGGIKSGGCACADELEALAAPLREAARRLAGAGAALVLTACTEIPLALGRERAGGVALLDPMQVAAQACVAIAAGERPAPV